MKKTKNLLKVFLTISLIILSIKTFSSCSLGNPAEEGYTEISGDLSGGAGGAPYMDNAPVSRLANIPLAGYRLYCVTLTDPPVDGTGVADASGNVIVLLKSKNPTFGCIVKDASGIGVASLFFSDNYGNSGQTISGSGDIPLGTITVSLINGVATATIPSSANIAATPWDAPCPVGTWVGSAWFDSECNPGADVIVTTFVTKTSSGNYVLSFSMGNVWIDPSETICGTTSFSNIPASYSDGEVSANFGYADPGCPSRTSSINMIVDESCKTATATITQNSCDDCSYGDGGCSGCGGSMTCTPSFTATRQ